MSSSVVNRDPDGVFIEVTDEGRWKPPDDPPSEERGRGLTLIRSLVSDAQIQTGEQGHHRAHPSARLTGRSRTKTPARSDNPKG